MRWTRPAGTRPCQRDRETEKEATLPYLAPNVPARAASDRCLDGISRISNIVRAMKEFAHPDQREKTPADLNQALQSTLIIARNEHKVRAEVTTGARRAAAVLCHIGDPTRVFLNLSPSTPRPRHWLQLVGQTGASTILHIFPSQYEHLAISTETRGSIARASRRERLSRRRPQRGLFHRIRCHKSAIFRSLFEM